jgi:hypothetical protein
VPFFSELRAHAACVLRAPGQRPTRGRRLQRVVCAPLHQYKTWIPESYRKVCGPIAFRFDSSLESVFCIGCRRRLQRVVCVPLRPATRSDCPSLSRHCTCSASCVRKRVTDESQAARLLSLRALHSQARGVLGGGKGPASACRQGWQAEATLKLQSPCCLGAAVPSSYEKKPECILAIEYC